MQPNLVPVVLKLKKYKSQGSNRILAEMTQAGGEKLLSEIHSNKSKFDSGGNYEILFR
jgi:hypothetical protein